MRHPPSAKPQGTINNLISHYGDTLISVTSYFLTWAMQNYIFVQDTLKECLVVASTSFFSKTSLKNEAGSASVMYGILRNLAELLNDNGK